MKNLEFLAARSLYPVGSNKSVLARWKHRLSDVDMLELLVYSRPSRRGDETVTWLQLRGADLHTFVNGDNPFVIPREKWEPRQSDLFEDFAKDYGLAPGMADQVRSGLSDLLGVESDELDEDSPWKDVDIDKSDQ